MGEVKKLSLEEFRKMQMIQLEMLKEFDLVCRKNGIRYSIFSGTLLGAVRHKGYIPWDDDADIAMLREDYEQFRKVADQLNPDICYFQDHETDPEYRWGYAKLRRTGTRFVRVGQEHLKCKTGVFIDILPMDDIPQTTAGQIWNDFYVYCLRKILWSEVGKYAPENNLFVRKVYQLLSKIPTQKVFARVQKMADRSKNSNANRVRVLLFPSLGKLYRKNPIKIRYGMPKEWFLEVTDYEFEGVRLLGTKDYDAILEYIFGDYMTPPPVEERTPHAPVSDYQF